MVLETDLETAVAAADDIPDAAEVYDPDEEIPITEFFDEAFVTTYTDFDTFDEMVAASPSNASSADELGRILDGEWDEFVAERTDFADEEAMVFAVRDHWVAKRLGL